MVVGGDLAEDLEVAGDAVGGLGLQRLVGVAGHQLAQQTLVLLRQLVEAQQLAQHHRVLAQRLVDQPLALLDALGDLHLALAVEQRHGAHLAQVHAHRVVGLLVRGEAEVGGLVLLLVEVAGARLQLVAVLVALGPVDDVDAEVGEADVDLVELVGEADHLLRQHLVDLVVEQIPLLLAQLDELVDRGVLVLDGTRVAMANIDLLAAEYDRPGPPQGRLLAATPCRRRLNSSFSFKRLARRPSSPARWASVISRRQLAEPLAAASGAVAGRGSLEALLPRSKRPF